MKSLSNYAFALLVALAASPTALAADAHKRGHDHAPLHGGVVAEVRDVDYELVVKADVVQLYARDHGKPLDVSKASAKVTLLAGTDKQEMELRPAGDRLEAKGNFKAAAGMKAVAVVTVPGRAPTTVRWSMK